MPAEAVLPRHRVEHVMGMAVSVALRGAGDPGAVAELFAWLRRVDRTFSTYDPVSAISRLNAGTLALGDAEPLVREVLARCDELRRATGGLFDARAPLPGGVDPSGYVKGWAVERGAALLERGGWRHFAIDAGGDVVVRGAPAPGRRWRVGIRHPGRGDRVAAVLGLTDAAVATSGAYERGAHVVDPRTGGAASGALSVTIVGPELGVADAYATAAFALGVDGPAWTATLAGHEALTILAGGRVVSTPGIAALRIRPRREPAPGAAAASRAR